MKHYLLILLLMSSLFVKAQLIKPFAGFSLYYNSDFKKSSYVGIHTGAEFKINLYIRPEIETSVLFGGIEEQTKLDDSGNTTDLYARSVSAINFSFSPKISLGDDDEWGSFISIRPKYNFSRIQASESHFIINKTNPSRSIEEQDHYNEWSHSLGIGVGFHFYLSDKNSDTVAFILYYQGIEMGNALSKLKFSTSNYSTKDIFGIGFTYYIGTKNKE